MISGRVAVVGGSIAGCAAAIALRRSGCDVTVYERSPGDLADRGFGVAVPVPVREQLVACGYLDSAMPVHRVSHRLWVTRRRNGSSRVLWRQPSTAVVNNWAVLWRTLRDRVPDQAYLADAAVDSVRRDGRHAHLRAHGRVEELFDLVVGADGYRSTVRQAVHPGVRADEAGYGVWRGIVPEGRLAASRWAIDLLEDSYVSIMFPGGHAVAYLVPAPHDAGEPCARLLIWGLYASRHRDVWGLVDEFFPTEWAEIARLTDQRALAVHPVLDLTVPSYVRRPFLLAGDAGAVARPHTASGAVKALLDAMSLEQAVAAARNWDDVLALYDKERCQAGNDLVELGRRMGRDFVVSTPDWTRMGRAELAASVQRTLAGRTHYLHGEQRANQDGSQQ